MYYYFTYLFLASIALHILNMEGIRPNLSAIKGSVLHSYDFGDLHVVQNGAIVYNSLGRILKVLDLDLIEDQQELDLIQYTDFSGKLIIPGFIDAHCHAPQYAFAGIGMHMPLLEWLEKYTFPSEARFSDLKFAEKVYRSFIRKQINSGTTFASYFATLHSPASKLLVDICREYGQRAFVGKVSMDRNSPSYYIENTAEGIEAAEEFVRSVLSGTATGKQFLDEIEKDPTQNEIAAITCHSKVHTLLNKPEAPLVMPVITPRFVPSCTWEMMSALGKISTKYGVAVQSHLSESPNEVDWVNELHPECDTYTAVYDSCDLLHIRSYMAHCCHCGDKERELLKITGTGVVNCASSNFMLSSGILDVRKFLSEGIKVALGANVGGGFSSSMLDAIRQSIIASRCLHIKYREERVEEDTDDDYLPLTYVEAFYLATQGGAEVLGMGDVVGNFLPGKKLDCLVIDVNAEGGLVDIFDKEDTLEKFQKFLFLGDDRNIHSVFIDGKKVK